VLVVGIGPLYANDYVEGKSLYSNGSIPNKMLQAFSSKQLYLPIVFTEKYPKGFPYRTTAPFLFDSLNIDSFNTEFYYLQRKSQ
jgi:hypothetical protein